AHDCVEYRDVCRPATGTFHDGGGSTAAERTPAKRPHIVFRVPGKDPLALTPGAILSVPLFIRRSSFVGCGFRLIVACNVCGNLASRTLSLSSCRLVLVYRNPGSSDWGGAGRQPVDGGPVHLCAPNRPIAAHRLGSPGPYFGNTGSKSHSWRFVGCRHSVS